MEKLIIDQLPFAATLRCNLRCKLCMVKSPYLKNQWHPTLAYLCEEIDRTFDVVDECNRLVFTGGEPLLRSDMGEVLIHSMKYADKVQDCIRIITNGTIMPDSKLMDVCINNKHKVNFLLDDYGISISKKVPEILSFFDKHGIAYEHRNNTSIGPHCGGWVDLGIGNIKRNSVDVAEKHFKVCVHSNKLAYAAGIDEGRLYACKMSKIAVLAGSETDDPSEYVDFMDESKSREELRDHLRNLYNRKLLSVCQYCTGFFEDSPRFIPGIQMTNEEYENIRKI